jgi:hypothetical protein
VERNRPGAPVSGGLRVREVLADLGALVLMAWLIPVAILAIGVPIMLIPWAVAAFARWMM